MFDKSKPEQKTSSNSYSNSLYRSTLPLQFASGAMHSNSLALQMMNEEETKQHKAKSNKTGIPTQLKESFEEKSGFSFDDVKVHYNSDKPAQLQALAYTQGNQVYVGPGQEKHLGHELGHVVQQKQGRVRPNKNIHGHLINDNHILESDADLLGIYSSHITSVNDNTINNTIQAYGWHQQIKTKNDQTPQSLKQHPFPNSKLTHSGFVDAGDHKGVYLYESTLIDKTTKLECIYESAAFIAELNVPTLNYLVKEKDSEKNINYFCVDVKSQYKTSQDKVSSLVLRYQFAKDGYGYIISIKENDNEYTMNPKRGSNEPLGINEYHSAHDKSSGAEITTLINSDENIAISLDAITKIAGEGARWQCVRKCNNLKNNTKFYTHVDSIGYIYITFSGLWASWKKEFNMKFDISNKDVKDKLISKKTSFVGVRIEQNIEESDTYCLDNGI